ncbi:hypothetical protein AB8881_08625 [Alphaproteobacteria bacterium LSUCC0396]
MSEDLKFTNKQKNIRMEGEEGSTQNRLRYELYTEGFKRIKEGLEEERYFEVCCIVDSIINDRLTALIQTIKNDDGIDYTYQSVGMVIRTLFKIVKEDKILLSTDFRKLMSNIEQIWLPKRNFVSHSFVGVTPSNIDLNLEDRLQIVKECGELGSKYCRDLTTECDKMIHIIKNYGIPYKTPFSNRKSNTEWDT